MAGDFGHNPELPPDVNGDAVVTPLDALVIVNHLRRTRGIDPPQAEGEATSSAMSMDVNDDGIVGIRDILLVVNHLARERFAPPPPTPLPDVFDGVTKAAGVGSTFAATFNAAESASDANLLQANEVETLLERAARVTSSEDAIIAVVDRSGRILGVRVERGVDAALQSDPDKLAFAIDGAVAKARTAAFFSSNAAPLTSRTIRFISQSTITQREVESAPLHEDVRYRGPGLVAPIGVGGHFPPEVAFTPQVDLFAIEHQSRDSRRHAGLDGVKSDRPGSDDFFATSRFNADPQFVPSEADEFFKTFPESFGEQSGTSPLATPRGVGTLPGGVPLYKDATTGGINLVGGIGVFFPGEDGFATHEQNFRHQSELGGAVQSEASRTNAGKVLEAEAMAFFAASGRGLVGPSAFLRDLRPVTASLPPLNNFVMPISRIDLVGITLEIFGPHPDRNFRQPGVDRLIAVAQGLGRGGNTGGNQRVTTDGDRFLDGQAVPEGWLVAPHDSDDPDGLRAADVQQIIERGVTEANRTRAAIRLNDEFRPGVSTRMVLAVADTDGDLLGLFRMPDATIFSIDVSVAKARNTAYYADADDLVPADRVDFDGDGTFGPIRTSTSTRSGDTLPLGTALTNRSFRFLVEPRFPTGIENPPALASGLVNDPNRDLCDQKPTLCIGVGPQSGLRLPGINPLTAENLDNDNPLAFDIYASPDHSSTVMFDSFNVMRNFRDPGDATVVLAGTNIAQPLANQNGVVFFPGSTPLYVDNRSELAGGFGVSGDGVDQDDVVTSFGQQGFDPLQAIRIDTYTIGGVRVPFQKFNRNPFGD